MPRNFYWELDGEWKLARPLREIPPDKFKCLDIHFNIWMRRYGYKETLKELMRTYVPYDLIETLVDDYITVGKNEHSPEQVELYIANRISDMFKYNVNVLYYKSFVVACKKRNIRQFPLYRLRHYLWFPKSQIHYLKRMYNKTKDEFYLDVLAYGVASGIYNYRIDRTIDFTAVEEEYLRRL